MKYFLAEIIGLGEGCDYTIGCNTKVEKYRAENEQEVIERILEDFGYNYLEPKINQINIFEISENYVKYVTPEILI